MKKLLKSVKIVMTTFFIKLSNSRFHKFKLKLFVPLYCRRTSFVDLVGINNRYSNFIQMCFLLKHFWNLLVSV